MSIQQQKFNIKIPHDTLVIFCKEKKTLTVMGPVSTKSMKLKLNVILDEIKKIVSVSPIPVFSTSNEKKKKINALRATTAAQIKQLFIESSTVIFQKLKIVGVGYRIDAETMGGNLFSLKLGYSHYFYVKISKDINLNCFSKTKFSIFGNSYHEISQLAAKIRSKKIPEPYKGKGVLYENETVTLKEGKKI